MAQTLRRRRAYVLNGVAKTYALREWQGIRSESPTAASRRIRAHTFYGPSTRVCAYARMRTYLDPSYARVRAETSLGKRMQTYATYADLPGRLIYRRIRWRRLVQTYATTAWKARAHVCIMVHRYTAIRLEGRSAGAYVDVNVCAPDGSCSENGRLSGAIYRRIRG